MATLIPRTKLVRTKVIKFTPKGNVETGKYSKWHIVHDRNPSNFDPGRIFYDTVCRMLLVDYTEERDNPDEVDPFDLCMKCCRAFVVND
jgi:hypothetical protein